MKLDTNNKELLIYKHENLEINLLGGIKLSGLDRLRCTLKIMIADNSNFPFRYSIDLYNSDQVERLIHRLVDHFEVDIKQVRTLLMGLTDELEHYRLTELDKYESNTQKVVELTEEEKKAAISYLQNKKLLDNLYQDIPKATQLVAENDNALLLYIIYTSKKLKTPLSSIIFGESGSGKTSLLQGVANLFPNEDVITVTSLSKNSLYYFDDLTDKLLLIEDLKGVSNEETLFALRELISNQKLSRSITERNFKGETTHKAKVLTTQVSVAACTTDLTTHPENQNRSIPIALDNNNAEREKAILEYKQKLAGGGIDTAEIEQLQKLLQNCHRLLKDVKVINPFAQFLKLPNTVKNYKRSMQLYLTFIETIAYLQQYSRKVRANTIEVAKTDIIWANKLLYKAFLQRSDELSSGSRKFLQTLQENGLNSFTIKDIKHLTHLSNIKRYLLELKAYGYIQITNGNRYKGYNYKLMKDDTWEQLKAELETLLQKEVVLD